MSTSSNPTGAGPYVVIKDGKKQGTYTNENEANAAAQQLRTVLESQVPPGSSAPQIEVKPVIQG